MFPCKHMEQTWRPRACVHPQRDETQLSRDSSCKQMHWGTPRCPSHTWQKEQLNLGSWTLEWHRYTAMHETGASTWAANNIMLVGWFVSYSISFTTSISTFSGQSCCSQLQCLFWISPRCLNTSLVSIFHLKKHLGSFKMQHINSSWLASCTEM